MQFSHSTSIYSRHLMDRYLLCNNLNNYSIFTLKLVLKFSFFFFILKQIKRATFQQLFVYAYNLHVDLCIIRTMSLNSANLPIFWCRSLLLSNRAVFDIQAQQVEVSLLRTTMR